MATDRFETDGDRPGLVNNVQGTPLQPNTSAVKKAHTRMNLSQNATNSVVLEHPGTTGSQKRQTMISSSTMPKQSPLKKQPSEFE